LGLIGEETSSLKANIVRIGFFWFLVVLFQLVASGSVVAWDNLSGGDHGGADWIITADTTIAKNHYNIRLFKIAAGITVTVQAYNGASYGWVEIHAKNIVIEGTLFADEAGYGGSAGSGSGGDVSNSQTGGTGGSTYGSTSSHDVEMGSGGGCSSRSTAGSWVGGGGGGGYGALGGSGATAGGGSGGDTGATVNGGKGGGKIILIADENITITGTVAANGGVGQGETYHTGGGGGGSGGGILIDGNRVFISGSIHAKGGKGGRAYHQLLGGGPCGSGGGGSGGRIKVFSNTLEFSGDLNVDGGAGGGTGDDSNYVGSPGNSGTIFVVGAPRLLNPENGSLVSPASVQFSWSNAYADNYRLIISSDVFFNNIVENVVLPGNSTSHTLQLPEGDLFWKVVAIRSAGEDSSESFHIKHYFPPEIMSIQCDNTIVDRNVNFSWAANETKIEITIRDNGGKTALVPENVRIWIRDANDSNVVENAPAESCVDVNENTRKFVYTFNPPDTLPDSALGPFDVKLMVRDNYGLFDSENFDGMGKELFIVNDLNVSLNILDNTPIYQLSVSGDVFRVYDNASTSADNVVVVDNNEGEIVTNFTDNSYSKNYGLISPFRLHRGDLGLAYVWVRDNVLDGVSTVLTYCVEGDNAKIINLAIDRQENRTTVTFDAVWASDGANLASGTVYLSENSQIFGDVSAGSGSLIIPHSSRINSGTKTLTLFDNADRPIWNVLSGSFDFNILPVAVELSIDNHSLPARVTPTPTFQWVFSDNNPNDFQQGVRIQVGSCLDNNDLWDWTDVVWTLQSKTYDGLALNRGTAYYVRMQVRDSQLEWQNTDNSESWTRSSFTVNCLPEISTLLTENQVNPSFIATLVPMFEWSFSDPDDDQQAKYQIQVGTSENENDLWDFTGFENENFVKYDGVPLESGAIYHVRVRVFDNLEWSDWVSGTFRASLPAPSLVSPANGSTNNTGKVELKWSSVENAENYEVFVSGTTYTLAQTSLWISLPEGTHSWKVRSVNGEGVKGEWSEIRTFTIDLPKESTPTPQEIDTNPPVMELLEPTENRVCENLRVKIRVSDESGIDADSIKTKLDGTSVEHTYSGNEVLIQLEGMKAGWHELSVEIQDLNKNLGTLNFYFEVVHENEKSQTCVLENLGVGESKSIFLENMDVRKITVTVENFEGRLERIDVDVAQIENLSYPDNLAIYSSLEISVNKPAEASVQVDIEFSVPWGWLKERGLNSLAIAMYQLKDNEWRELPTHITGSDNEVVDYVVTAQDFSPFVIGGKTVFPTFQLILPTQPIDAEEGSLKVELMATNPTNQVVSETLVIEVGGNLTQLDVTLEPYENNLLSVFVPVEENTSRTQVEVKNVRTGEVLSAGEIEISNQVNVPSQISMPVLLGVLAVTIGIGVITYFWRSTNTKRIISRGSVKKQKIKIRESSSLIQDYYELLLPLVKSSNVKKTKNPREYS